MKYRVRLFREIISLEHIEIDVRAESEMEARQIASAKEISPHDKRIREGSLVEATAWQIGDLNVSG